MVDIHSHILPGIDDGAKSVLESEKLLKQMADNGVDTAVATPHFYPDNMDLEEFISDRLMAYNSIKNLSKSLGVRVLLGAEVYYFSGIGVFEDVKKLTLANSRYLLLELLGIKVIDDKILKDIISLKENLGIVPIIAHMERYCKYRGYKELLSLVDGSSVLCQINASYFFSSAETRAVKKLVKSGRVDFVASDCHSSVNRPVYLKAAYDRIQELSVEQYNRILNNTQATEKELLSAYDEQNG